MPGSIRTFFPPVLLCQAYRITGPTFLKAYRITGPTFLKLLVGDFFSASSPRFLFML